ncbi:response regulator transcription factor [Salinibacterium sp. ZJ454]|uniref:response regulator transcription factor n=1 Tax=Salinibacterium sp. ZJ454 TaxID=2708339 RepID=UPI00141E84A9|nr:response regulator transcription factor [Salinibacterium sp. ZJ454]
MATILIAEDEARISQFIESGLTAAGYSVSVASTGSEAIAMARSFEFDLMILDVGLPVIDGFSILKTLRGEGHQLAIIMLTARGSSMDTVRGLEGGANDYLSKPFRFDELLARVRLRLKDAAPSASSDLLRHGDLELDHRTRRISVAGKTVDLSAREFGLAVEFLQHPEQVLSREQLLSRVWGVDFDPESNIVDVYIRHLRAKIGRERLETVRGMGYRLK